MGEMNPGSFPFFDSVSRESDGVMGVSINRQNSSVFSLHLLSDW